MDIPNSNDMNPVPFSLSALSDRECRKNAQYEMCGKQHSMVRINAQPNWLGTEPPPTRDTLEMTRL